MCLHNHETPQIKKKMNSCTQHSCHLTTILLVKFGKHHAISSESLIQCKHLICYHKQCCGLLFIIDTFVERFWGQG